MQIVNIRQEVVLGPNLIEQTETPCLALLEKFVVRRVGPKASTREDALHFGHHRCNPAHVVVLAHRTFGSLLALRYVSQHWLKPESPIGVVDGCTER